MNVKVCYLILGGILSTFRICRFLIHRTGFSSSGPLDVCGKHPNSRADIPTQTQMSSQDSPQHNCMGAMATCKKLHASKKRRSTELESNQCGLNPGSTEIMAGLDDLLKVTYVSVSVDRVIEAGGISHGRALA